MKFSGYNIHADLKKNIDRLGYKKPTDIQYKSIPHILKGEDVLAIAQTGTGKTAAYAIPLIDMVHQLKGKKTDKISALIMAPTHELVQQIDEVFKDLSAGMKISSFGLYGGVGQDRQKVKLHLGVDILIATPGRLFDLVSQGALELRNVQILVLDEADHMLDLGFLEDIKQLTTIVPKERQTLFFSATIDKKIKKVAYSLVRSAIRIEVSPKDPVSKNIDHSVAFISMDDKRFFLKTLIQNSPEAKVLVFVRTKVRAERLYKSLEGFQIESATIHSDKNQEDRDKVMMRFRQGDNSVLIATDISARGIDIPDVDIVVNYDVPEQPENYVHRVGRTGRGKKRGSAVTFCSEEEKVKLDVIEKNLKKPINPLEISKKDYKMTLEEGKKEKSGGPGDWRDLMGNDEM